ncbi:spore germination protein [Cytobacillus spongiae]|jgi:spore germination protein (amino acid permease)|uniref:GerAB/ArcD/ProY family transporter n=1 Tax=Cytobacillus spongiae TaxID=2901381 RepID=UPI001F274571|nr:GerAB/ArcD/ProY family transporter [Cytobacillus spongiae]UII55470.1 spore germination protein [Cytobacillus spongiae]
MIQPQQIQERLQISPYLVFFPIISMQIGIGVLGYQRIISQDAGYDGWISVLVAGLSIHPLIWIIYKINGTVNGDMIAAHEYILGKVGKFFTTIFVFYYCLLAIAVLRTYIEVIQVWLFHDLSTFWFSIAIILLAIYVIDGGFRTVTGIAFFGIVLPAYLLFTFAFAIKYADFRNLLPIYDHSLKEILTGSYHMSLTYIGYGTLLFFYPFIKKPKESRKWAHLAILTTTLVYTVLIILTFAYFSEGQIEKNVWATLTMWKIVEFPFVERFEYIGIATWSLVILPNVCIPLWCGSRIIKQVFHIRQRSAVWLLATICLTCVCLFQTRDQINMLNDITGKVGFAFSYFYIPLLFVLIMIAKKVKDKNEQK